MKTVNGCADQVWKFTINTPQQDQSCSDTFTFDFQHIIEHIKQVVFFERDKAYFFKPFHVHVPFLLVS